jgi:hypothetical protein
MPSIDHAIQQDIIANTQATHDKLVCNSVGMGIRQLLATYSHRLSKSFNYQTHPSDFLSNCTFLVDPASLSKNDKAAMLYLLKQAKSPIDGWDYVTLYLPSLDSANPFLKQCYHSKKS